MAEFNCILLKTLCHNGKLKIANWFPPQNKAMTRAARFQKSHQWKTRDTRVNTCNGINI